MQYKKFMKDIKVTKSEVEKVDEENLIIRTWFTNEFGIELYHSCKLEINSIIGNYEGY